MTSKFLIAAATAGLLFGAVQVASAADAPKPPPLTPAVAKALMEAQKAGNAKDYPTAMAAIASTSTVTGRRSDKEATVILRSRGRRSGI